MPGTVIGKRVEDGTEPVVRHVGSEIVRHPLVGPGEMSILDEHYGRPARPPVRAVRPRTPAEIAFLALGPVAEAFLRAAAAAGVTKLPTELGLITDLDRAHGGPALLGALERALAFGRFRADEISSILAQGGAVPTITDAGETLGIDLPVVSVRPLAAYAIGPGR